MAFVNVRPDVFEEGMTNPGKRQGWLREVYRAEKDSACTKNWDLKCFWEMYQKK